MVALKHLGEEMYIKLYGLQIPPIFYHSLLPSYAVYHHKYISISRNRSDQIARRRGVFAVVLASRRFDGWLRRTYSTHAETKKTRASLKAKQGCITIA